MTLRKKIFLSFIISALVIGVLTTFEYINFLQIRNEMNYLEVADSARNRSLELGRHEKNFFLYPNQAQQEAAATLGYVNQLENLTGDIQSRDAAAATTMRQLLSSYQTEFGAIQTLLAQISNGNQALQATFPTSASLIPLFNAESRDNPSQVADYLQNYLGLPAGNPQVAGLRQLDVQVGQLRDTSESIVATANSLDSDARNDALSVTRYSQIAILVVFPLFLIIGMGALLNVSTGIVNRLKVMSLSIDKIGEMFGRGAEGPREVPHAKEDEVDELVDKFNKMNQQRLDWEREQQKKNQEALLQAKKLAAIGILASGVAHELNNPLSNVSLTAQVLRKQIGPETQPEVREMVDDIVAQTERVKNIVGDLLEFAREREVQLQEVGITELARDAYGQVERARGVEGIEFDLTSEPEGITLLADRAQLERVFVNLFLNAIDAMGGQGRVSVRISERGNLVDITVADSGPGIPEADREKIFDPFFTMKEKGTGLGLAIVMNTIQKHGGRITVAGKEGEGAVFEIELPKAGRIA